MDVREQPDICDGLEARAIYQVYVRGMVFLFVSANPLNSDLWPYNRKKNFGGGRQAGQVNPSKGGKKSGGMLQRIKNVFTKTRRPASVGGIPTDVNRLYCHHRIHILTVVAN